MTTARPEQTTLVGPLAWCQAEAARYWRTARWLLERGEPGLAEGFARKASDRYRALGRAEMVREIQERMGW